MNIPTIGGARGIFEIFVPGTFLLLNLGFFVYMSPFTDAETRRLIAAGATSPAIAVILAVSFGYLIGILLRLFKTDWADNASVFLLRRSKRRENPQESRLWATEEFPYIGWIGESCKLYLSTSVRNFYDKTWGLRILKGQNKQFFNFSKVVISSKDEQAAAEIYAAEALTRYISGMFYALAFAFILFVITILSIYFNSGQLSGGLIFVAAAYLFAIIIILTRFKFIRIKEVEAVFAASYKNRELFEELAAGGKTDPGSRSGTPEPARPN